MLVTRILSPRCDYLGPPNLHFLLMCCTPITEPTSPGYFHESPSPFPPPLRSPTTTLMTCHSPNCAPPIYPIRLPCFSFLFSFLFFPFQLRCAWACASSLYLRPINKHAIHPLLFLPLRNRGTIFGGSLQRTWAPMAVAMRLLFLLLLLLLLLFFRIHVRRRYRGGLGLAPIYIYIHSLEHTINQVLKGNPVKVQKK